MPGKNISLVTCFLWMQRKEESHGSVDCWEKSAFRTLPIIDYNVSLSGNILLKVVLIRIYWLFDILYFSLYWKKFHSQRP